MFCEVSLESTRHVLQPPPRGEVPRYKLVGLS